MTHIFLSLLEHALSAYLALDPETLKHLANLSGKNIKITLTDWHVTCYLFPTPDGIQIKTHSVKNPDAEIEGPAPRLLRIRFSDKKTALQLAKKIVITGDIHLAQTFLHILKQIEVDWEEVLSRLTGDVIAHQIGSFTRALKRWGIRTRKNLHLNIKEYLQEESHHLPSSEEAEVFFTEISQLKNDLARLEAKLNTP